MKGMESLGYWIAKNPLVIVILAGLLTAGSLHYAQTVEMQGMTTEAFVGKDSPLYQLYDHLYVEMFGTDSVIVLIEGEDIATADVLEPMHLLSKHIREAPGVIGSQSIADLVIAAEAQKTGVGKIPDSQEEIDGDLASADPLALQAIMPDRRHTILGVKMPLTLSESEMQEIQNEVEEEIALVGFPPDIGVTVTGSPALSASIMAEMSKSNGILMGLAGILMIVALFLVFRHVKWALLPIPIVFLGIIWTFGAMGFLKIPMSMVSMSAFPILIGIGIDYAIQFHNRIDEELSRGENSVAAVVNTVSHTAMPVMIALVITAAGFLSLLTSSVPMTRDFGLICLIGLFMCYLSALFIGITVLYAVDRRGLYRRKADASNASNESAPAVQGRRIGDLLEKSAVFCLQRWKVVLVAAFILSVAGTYADYQVPVETDFKTYIPQDLPPLVDFRHMEEIFGGSDQVNFVVQADDVTKPSTLEWMDDFGTYIQGSRAQILGATSIATFVKAENGGVIPDNQTRVREIIASLPESVRDEYLDGQDTAMINLDAGKAVADLGAEGSDRLLKEIDKDLVWFPPPPGVSVRVTGDMMVMTTVIAALTTGRTEMTLLGLVLIFGILLIIYRDLIKALLPVLPMLVVIGWMGGVMYLAGMKYTPLTATLGALILGVGSEYAILMMERFYEELEKIGDPTEALKIATNRIGSALVASGMTTVFGFAALIASPFMITNNFGTVTVLAVVFVLFTTFTVFVVLMLRMEMRREALQAAKLRLIDAKRRTLD